MMGWKAVRDHYGIKHLVHVRYGCLTIGSPYVTRALAFDPDGRRVHVAHICTRDSAFWPYAQQIAQDPAKFRELFAQKDQFSRSIPVYCGDENGAVKEDFCEMFAALEVTHSGDLMYANTHFTDRGQAARYVEKELKLSISATKSRIGQLSQEVRDLELKNARQLAALAALRAREDLPPLAESVPGADEADKPEGPRSAPG